MPRLGVTEMAILLVIVVIIFGAGKLPEIGGSLGKGIREFKSATGDDAESAPVAVAVDTPPAPERQHVRADEI